MPPEHLEPAWPTGQPAARPAAAATTRPAAAAVPAQVPRWWGLLCAHDVVTLAYFLIVRGVLALLPPSPARSSCSRTIEIGLGLAVLGIAAARLVPRLPGLVRAIVYRAGLVGALAISYVALREQLPIARQVFYDEALLAMDRAIFGVEPAVWLQRINVRPVVEYFSFFYFNYYTICAGFMIVCTWIMRGDSRLTEFAFGTITLYFTAHLLYMVVPAYGPWIYLRSELTAPLDGGFFWKIVHTAVTEGSPVKEIFPSMHTAGPTWFTLYAIHRARTDRRWRLPAVVTGFFAANIVFSTVFLRWHYAIDIVAGLALAALVAWATPRVVRAEAAWRQRNGFEDPWPVSPWFSRPRKPASV